MPLVVDGVISCCGVMIEVAAVPDGTSEAGQFLLWTLNILFAERQVGRYCALMLKSIESWMVCSSPNIE